MSIRYTDNNNVSSGGGDFVIRRRSPTLPQLLCIFIATFIISISLTISATDKLALGAIMVILFTGIGSYMAVQLQRSRDLVLTTEFQNALFASALGINNKFCLITRHDGTIVYLNRSFQELFPDFIRQPQRTVSMLLSFGKLSAEDGKKIFTAIENNVYDKVLFNMYDATGKFHRIVMSVEPILRPSGYILLRGREFIDDRSLPEKDGSVQSFNKSTIALFSYVMDTMDVGVYMIGPSGNFIYANPILEQWLGFGSDEITSSNLSLKDILRSSESEFNAVQPNNYEGPAKLQRKSVGSIQVFINQKAIRNDQNNTIGYTALVHNVTAQIASEKKKLW